MSTGHSDGGFAESADQKFARSRMKGLGPVVQHRIIAGTYFLSYRCEKQFIVSSGHFENDIIAIISTLSPMVTVLLCLSLEVTVSAHGEALWCSGTAGRSHPGLSLQWRWSHCSRKPDCFLPSLFTY